jgi:hypothetical protein
LAPGSVRRPQIVHFIMAPWPAPHERGLIAINDYDNGIIGAKPYTPSSCKLYATTDGGRKKQKWRFCTKQVPPIATWRGSIVHTSLRCR